MSGLVTEKVFSVLSEEDTPHDNADSGNCTEDMESSYEFELIKAKKPSHHRKSVFATIDGINKMMLICDPESNKIQRPKLNGKSKTIQRIRSLLMTDDNLSVKENLNGEYKDMYSESFYNPIVNDQKKRQPFKKKKKLVKRKNSTAQCDCYCDFSSLIGNIPKNVLKMTADSSTDRVSKKKDSWSVETRRQSILLKLLKSSENSITQEEEEDINERAECFAMTVPPDKKYYILPDGNDTSICVDNKKVNDNTAHKSGKKRKSYDNIECVVKYTETINISDTSYVLPQGTKLLKPTDKLIEIVAEAIEGSPDHMLQVHQIYTFLQNKYPYFRHMGKGNIASWRSSIRHALYQKWFKKIKLESYSNSKGCYWTLNPDATHLFSQKINNFLSDFMNGLSDGTASSLCSSGQDEFESSLNQSRQDNFDHSEFADLQLKVSDCTDLGDLNNQMTTNVEDIFGIAQECGISVMDCEVNGIKNLNIAQPILDSDPILSGYGQAQSQNDMEVQEAVDVASKILTDNSSLSQSSAYDALLSDSLWKTPESNSLHYFVDRRVPSPLFSSPDFDSSPMFCSPPLSTTCPLYELTSEVASSPFASSTFSPMQQATGDDDFSLMESQVITLLPGHYYATPTSSGEQSITSVSG